MNKLTVSKKWAASVLSKTFSDTIDSVAGQLENFGYYNPCYKAINVKSLYGENFKHAGKLNWLSVNTGEKFYFTRGILYIESADTVYREIHLTLFDKNSEKPITPVWISVDLYSCVTLRLDGTAEIANT